MLHVFWDGWYTLYLSFQRRNLILGWLNRVSRQNFEKHIHGVLPDTAPWFCMVDDAWNPKVNSNQSQSTLGQGVVLFMIRFDCIKPGRWPVIETDSTCNSASTGVAKLTLFSFHFIFFNILQYFHFNGNKVAFTFHCVPVNVRVYSIYLNNPPLLLSLFTQFP